MMNENDRQELDSDIDNSSINKKTVDDDAIIKPSLDEGSPIKAPLNKSVIIAIISAIAVITIALVAILGGNGKDDNSNSDDSDNQETSNHTHTFEEWTTIKNPSCTVDGVNERYCACGEKQTQTISAYGHTEVIDPSVDATCIETGLTEGKHCSECNAVIVKQNIVEKSTDDDAHNWVYATYEWATHCLWCGLEIGEPITRPKLTSSKYNLELEDTSYTCYISVADLDDVTLVYDINDTSIISCRWGEWDDMTVPITITPLSQGNTYVTIYVEEYPDIEITINVSVDEHSHSFSTIVIEPQCLVGGYTIHSCNCGYSYNTDPTSAKGHNEVIDPAVPATPTSTGLTEGKHCSVCNTIIVKQELVPIQRTITIDGEGEIFSYYIGNTIRSSTFIESVEYTISEQANGKMEINIKYLVEMLYNGGSAYVAFKVELHNSDGVCIATRNHFSSAEYDTKYLLKDSFYNLEPGDYTIVIKDY